MKRKPARGRLDQLLVERGLADSLSKAAAMVLAGEVLLDGTRAEKPGALVDKKAVLEIFSRRQKYVSRGGFKLEGALRDFHVDPANCVCLDIGSSHGGFTDCLLQLGAARVYAVDVNVEQLDWKLRQDPRVVPVKHNAREALCKLIPEVLDLIVIDVSFISVCKVISPAAAVAKRGASFLILVKPQFELPRGVIGPGGIVADKVLHEEAILSVRAYVKSIGLEFLGVRPSQLPGTEGNLEYFLHARKKLVE